MTKAYIINSYRVPESVKTFVLDHLLHPYNNPTRQLFVHILFGTIYYVARDRHLDIDQREEGWVPISYNLMKKEWGKPEELQWGLLVEDGLLEVKVIHETEDGKNITYSRDYGKSREFRVPLDVLEQILGKYPKETSEAVDCQYYNLVTGNKMKVSKRHKFTDENENSIPELIKESMKAMKRCLVNDKAVRKYLDDKEFDAEFGGSNKERARYINDRNCYETVKKTGIKFLEDGLIEYYPSYKAQMSGRLTEIEGGLQSCSREMKQVAFSGIDNLKNYDLKSSQVWGLIQWFEAANINTKWLRFYLSRDKREFAKAVGISRDRWKQCLLALEMGGNLPKKVTRKNFLDPDLAIINYLMEEAKGDECLALKMYVNFLKLTAPLKASIDKWQDWLINTYVPLSSSYPRGKQYVSNKTGITFCISDYRTPDGNWKNLNQLKRRLAAFYLQGNEAAFIHHLTWVSERYGFEVMNNQHDGFVVMGEIPEEAVEYARQQSGLKYAILEEKPFLEKGEKEPIYEFVSLGELLDLMR